MNLRRSVQRRKLKAWRTKRRKQGLPDGLIIEARPDGRVFLEGHAEPLEDVCAEWDATGNLKLVIYKD